MYVFLLSFFPHHPLPLQNRPNPNLTPRKNRLTRQKQQTPFTQLLSFDLEAKLRVWEEEGDGELSDPGGEDEDEICCVDGLEKRSATGVGIRLNWSLR